MGARWDSKHRAGNERRRGISVDIYLVSDVSLVNLVLAVVAQVSFTSSCNRIRLHRMIPPMDERGRVRRATERSVNCGS